MINIPLTVTDIHFKVRSMTGIIKGDLLFHQGTVTDRKSDFKEDCTKKNKNDGPMNLSLRCVQKTIVHKGKNGENDFLIGP